MSPQPQTEACTPRPLLEPQTLLPLLHPKPTPPSLAGPLAAAVTAGFEADEVDLSLAEASPGVKPKPRGDGSGVVERLFSAGLEAGAVV